MAVPDFLAGLIYGMTTDNHLTEIEMCYEGGVTVDEFFKTAMADLKQGGTDWALLRTGISRQSSTSASQL